MHAALKFTLSAFVIAGLSACSSSSDSTDPDTSSMGDQATVADDGDNIAGGDAVGGEGNTSDDNTDTENTTTEDNTVTENVPAGGADNFALTSNPGPDELPAPIIPELDPTAAPIPAPDSSDPFGYQLETDPEPFVVGGPPTQPKNLRVDLISNDWAELNWAPANDDGEVVEYRIYRSDGHIYSVSRDATSTNGGTQREYDKQWATTTFIDCNYTRFPECQSSGPQPGQTFTYEVSAVDNENNESPLSNPVTITYHADQNAPVPLFEDRFQDSSGFLQNHDLSNSAYFIDDFTLVFEDDFNSPTIDDSLWNTQLVWGDSFIINNEQQYFVNTQDSPDFGYNPFKIEDSILTIEAIPTPDELRGQLPDKCFVPNDFHPPCEFLSGALATQDKFNMTFGYVEARMKTSDISGALSSFYLYHRYKGDGITRHAPEIDIIEYLGENPYGDEDAFQTYHFDDVNTGITRSSPTMIHKNPTGELYSDEFHTYSVLWEPQLVIWYIDGEEIKRITGPQVGARAMNIVVYLVAGSGWAPTPDENGTFPLQFEIDYIRAYQRDFYTTNGLYPVNPADLATRD